MAPAPSPAPGETSLSALLATLKLTLHPDTFVFLTFPPSSTAPPSLLVAAQMIFHEAEGTTVITTLESAQAHEITNYTFPCRMITCEVHSSLEAVGFMAILAGRLAEKGMGCNPVSGFFYDHFFVPVQKGEEAVGVLRELAKEHGGDR